MTSRTGNSGFTLVEVLVAAVILFAGLGAILKAYGMAVAALESATDVLITSSWMQDRAAEIALQAKSGELGASVSGRMRLEGRDYLRSIEVRRKPVARDVELQSAVIQLSRWPAGTPHVLQAEWVLFREPESSATR